MLKLYFFAVIDELTETVVNIFHARNLEHAKMIVKNSFKDADSDVVKSFSLVKISDLIEVVNDFDSIVKFSCDKVMFTDSTPDDLSIDVSEILENSKKEN